MVLPRRVVFDSKTLEVPSLRAAKMLCMGKVVRPAAGETSSVGAVFFWANGGSRAGRFFFVGVFVFGWGGVFVLMSEGQNACQIMCLQEMLVSKQPLP